MTVIFLIHYADKGGPSKSVFGKSWAFGPTRGPPSRKLGGKKKKTKFNVYFAFYAILSILFFHEIFFFFGWDNELAGPRPS